MISRAPSSSLATPESSIPPLEVMCGGGSTRFLGIQHLMNVIHHQPQHKAVRIHHDDALVFLDVMGDHLLEFVQRGDRPGSGKDLFARGARGIVVAALFAAGAQLKLLDDLFVEAARFRQRLHQELTRTIGFGQPGAQVLGHGSVHLRLRTVGEVFAT